MFPVLDGLQGAVEHALTSCQQLATTLVQPFGVSSSMQHQKVADMSSSCCTAAPGAVETSRSDSLQSAAAAPTGPDADDAGLDPDDIQAAQHQDESAVALRQAAAAATPSAAASAAAAASSMQLISTTAPQNAMTADCDYFGEYCINLVRGSATRNLMQTVVALLFKATDLKHLSCGPV